MLLCLKCHASNCAHEHVGHPGTCELCGADRMVCDCDQASTEAVERLKRAGMPTGTCFNCRALVVRPKILEQYDDKWVLVKQVLACADCCNMPWAMHERMRDLELTESGQEEYLAILKRLNDEQRREGVRTAIATLPPDDLRAMIERLDDARHEALERVAALEENRMVMMGELEDALSTRDSLSDQLEDTHARLNVHKKKFPTMLFHRDGKTAVVQNPEQKRELTRTGEWFDHPDKAEESRLRVYNLKKPTETVINDKPDGELAAMSPGEKAARIGSLLKEDGQQRREIDRDRIDVKVEHFEPEKLPPGKVH